jgi:hypothetical protein
MNKDFLLPAEIWCKGTAIYGGIKKQMLAKLSELQALA